ncbi:MAG: cell wall-binding repeat-containing protein [bacterium]|nr:cell wall-binding repeat-containing protein [bacterium]
MNKTLRRSLGAVLALALAVALLGSALPTKAITIEDLARIAGADRFATSVAISQNHYPADGSASIAVIASGRNHPDALAGVTLAALGDGPLLLTEPTDLPNTIKAELLRALPSGSTIYLLGGESAISRSVEDTLISLGYTVQRIAGANRYGTSTNIAAEVDRLPAATAQDHLYIVSGASFADALSVSPLAARDGQVLLLTPRDQLSIEQQAYLDATPSITRATIIGGTAVIAGSIHEALAARGLSVDRIGGANRYETSRLVANVFANAADQPAGVGLASGANYPDALSAGPDLASRGLPLLLTQQNNIGCIATGGFLADFADRMDGGFVYGGSAVISNRTESYAELLVSGNATTGNCDTADLINPYSTPCPSPFDISMPIDLSLATSVLYPGQYRGEQYKPHGGFRFDTSDPDDITVTAPFDADVYSGSAHMQSGEVQYYFDFLHPCGIRYRVDHLNTLSPKFQAFADQYLPLGPEGDSSSINFGPFPIKRGEVIATAVGFYGVDGNPENVGMDWGLYDLRQTNTRSLDPAWSAIHSNVQEQHAVCVWDWLDPSTRAAVYALPAADGVSGDASDYCPT